MTIPTVFLILGLVFGFTIGLGVAVALVCAGIAHAIGRGLNL